MDFGGFWWILADFGGFLVDFEGLRPVHTPGGPIQKLAHSIFLPEQIVKQEYFIKIYLDIVKDVPFAKKLVFRCFFDNLQRNPVTAISTIIRSKSYEISAGVYDFGF